MSFPELQSYNEYHFLPQGICKIQQDMISVIIKWRGDRHHLHNRCSDGITSLVSLSFPYLISYVPTVFLHILETC